MTDTIMKQFSRIALTAGAALALTAAAGCSGEIFDGPGHGANTLITASSQAPADGSGTRTAVDPTQYEDGSMGLNWVDTDKIGVFGNSGSNNIEFTKAGTGEAANATFGGNLAADEQPQYAYFPYSQTAGADPSALTGTLKPTQTYNSATRQLESEDDWKVATGFSSDAEGQYRMQFRHIFAFFRFDVSAPEGCELQGQKLQSIKLKIDGKQLAGNFTLDLTAQTPEARFTESAGMDQLEMKWTDTPVLTAGEFYGYLSCAPQTGMTGKTIEIEITTDQKIASFKATCAAERIEPDSYYTLNFNLKKYQDSPQECGWSVIDNPNKPVEENAAWVSGLNTHLACANTVFAIAGQPFMHKIRVPGAVGNGTIKQKDYQITPTKEGISRVWNLPDGLTWNADRCLVQGTAPAAGDYIYSVEFTTGGQTYKEGIKLHVAASASDLISPTPMMGWQTWNVLKDGISEEILTNQLNAMQSLGLIDAGYKYFGIDDCWQLQNQNDNGHQIPDSKKFPNGMKAMADKIHSYGLKAGIYTDCGTKTCEKYFASYGYEELHAQDYYNWGFNFVKEDWYYSTDMAPTGATASTFVNDYDGLSSFWNTPAKAHELYSKMGQALAKNKIMLYMCEWGIHQPWKWAAETGATCWRMSYDARDGWWGANGSSKNDDENTNGVGLHNTIVLMRNLWPYVGINRYNDADMLCVGIRGTGQSSNDCVYGVSKLGNNYYSGLKKYTGMSDAEYETNFAMWCMYSSPLLLTLDMTRSDLNTHDLNLIKNSELIAINQDALGQGAEYIKTVDGCDYYMKDLANGDVAIAVVNLGDSQANYSISLSDFEALSAGTTYKVRNLLAKSDAGTLSSASALTGSVAAHGTYIIRLSRQ